jgi:hypothetical protein
VHGGTLIAIVLAGGFLASALVRFSPGFDSIPEDLDPNIGPSTLQALHRQHERANSLPVFYARYLAAAVHGDFGNAQTLKQPVSELIRDRAPVTARLVLIGTTGGLLLGSLLAWIAVWTRREALGAAASSISGLLLAVPPAVLALAFFFFEAPLALALSLALLPRVFGTMRALLEECHASPALLAAWSDGRGDRNPLRDPECRAAVARTGGCGAGARLRVRHSDRSFMRGAWAGGTGAAGRYFTRHAVVMRASAGYHVLRQLRPYGGYSGDR